MPRLEQGRESHRNSCTLRRHQLHRQHVSEQQQVVFAERASQDLDAMISDFHTAAEHGNEMR